MDLILIISFSGRSHCRLQGEGQQVRLPLRPRRRLQPQIHQGKNDAKAETNPRPNLWRAHPLLTYLHGTLTPFLGRLSLFAKRIIISKAN